MKKALFTVMFVLVTTNILPQNHTVSRFDLLLYGGLEFNHKKNFEFDFKRTTWSLKTGFEFYCFRWLSIGLDLDYGNTGEDHIKLKEGDFFTTPFLNLYFYKLFYLSGSYTYHRPITLSFKYPYSFEGHIFSAGVGKKFFVHENLLIDVDARFYHSKEYGIDAQDEPHLNTTIGMTLNASLLIYFGLGSKDTN